MTEEQKLQEYLKQNAVKETPKTKKDKSSKEDTTENRDGKTALGWYVGDTIYFCIRRLFLTVGVTMMGTLIITSGEAFGNDKFIYIFLFAAAMFLALTVPRFKRFQEYKKWIRGGFYPLQGWDNFFAKRKETFWKGAYTTIRVSIKLKSNATDLHQQAVATFFKKWTSEWKDRYKKKEWEMGGQPTDFTFDGKAFFGDINPRGLHLFIEKMITDLPPLTNVLGQYLDTVVIDSSSKDNNYEETKDPGPDAYERQQTYEALH